MPDKKASIDILFHTDFSSIQLQKAMDETIFNCQMIELLYWQLSMCIYVYGGHKVNSRKMSMNLNFCTCSCTCFVKFTKPVYHKQTRHETTKICTVLFPQRHTWSCKRFSRQQHIDNILNRACHPFPVPTVLIYLHCVLFISR